jgi:DNA-directed RNA polymerase specialized sigma24 family protein
VPEPAATATGPTTFASRREQLVLATKALDLLLPRDRDLVKWSGEGLSTEEQARRLDLSAEAAGRARRRALDRFRKAFRLVSGAP